MEVSRQTFSLVLFILIGCQIVSGSGFRSYFNNYYDEIATSTCTALSASHNVRGHIAGVRRACSASTASCADICTNAKKTPYFSGTWKCFDALHIYKKPSEDLSDNFEKENDSGKVGLYTYRYGGCGGSFCGPNYCCCVGV